MLDPHLSVHNNFADACGVDNIFVFTPQSFTPSLYPRKGHNMVALMPALNMSLRKPHCSHYLVLETDMYIKTSRMSFLTHIIRSHPGDAFQFGNVYVIPRSGLERLMSLFPTDFGYDSEGCPIGIKAPLNTQSCPQDMVLPRMFQHAGITMHGKGGCAADKFNICFELKYAHDIPNIVKASCQPSEYHALNFEQKRYMDRRFYAVIFHHVPHSDLKALKFCV